MKNINFPSEPDFSTLPMCHNAVPGYCNSIGRCVLAGTERNQVTSGGPNGSLDADELRGLVDRIDRSAAQNNCAAQDYVKNTGQAIIDAIE